MQRFAIVTIIFHEQYAPSMIVASSFMKTNLFMKLLQDSEKAKCYQLSIF